MLASRCCRHRLHAKQLRRAFSGVCANVCEAIGNTPLVQLNRVVGEGAKAKRVLAKLEMQNPGGSVKDRIALGMVEAAERSGALRPGMTIVEATSGNTGIGLAMVAAAKGYKCIIIMPQMPPMMERYTICRKFGAEVHLTAGAAGAPMAENMFDHLRHLLAENPDYWSPMQFENDANPQVHVATTGPEIWSQTGGEVDYFVAGAGTGGTMVGAGVFLKEKNPDLVNVIVEPAESRVLAGEPSDKHTVVGIGAGVPLKFVEGLEPGAPWADGPRGAVSEFASCSSGDAVTWANRLAREEGLLVGPSTGAACKVAVELAHRDEAADKTVVVVFPSSAVRYMTHPLWAAEQQEGTEILGGPPDFTNEPPLLRWRSSDYAPPPPPG